MSEIVKIRAKLTFNGKSKAVMPGFRPTLLFGEKKALCNIEAVAPMPLPPNQEGSAIIKLIWDWQDHLSIQAGSAFVTLEGEKGVGYGIVLERL